MVYLIISSTGSYQLNSFNPHMVTGFNTDVQELLSENPREYSGDLLVTSIEERVDQLNSMHDGRSTYTYLPPVATKADLLTTYPELFV